MTEKPTPQQVLATPMQDNDADAATIGEYLTELLFLLWREAEGFNGKRPFGNSDWQYDIYRSLGVAGFVRYVEDDDGYCEDVDTHAADELVGEAIRAMVPAAPVEGGEPIAAEAS